MAEDRIDDFEDEGTLVVEQHFAIVPEWVIDADISDCAYRLYSVLLRYGQSSGQRMPGRALLAQRLRKRSKDTVDRAMKELVAVGAVVVERRRRGRQNLTNRYHLMSTSPAARPLGRGGRTDAATPPGRSPAATPGRTGAATPGPARAAILAAVLRPDPGALTQEVPPPPASCDRTADRRGGGGTGHGDTHPAAAAVTAADLAALGVAVDLEALAAECQRLRRALGQPATRWTARRVAEVLAVAVTDGGWPAQHAAAALRAVAADPATKSPMRLTCPGPWWDTAEQAAARGAGTRHDIHLPALEQRLAELGGRRVALQRRARAELEAAGLPLTRSTVARRSVELLEQDPGPHDHDEEAR
ncbi:hypothetical protein [Vallicoccus soli]|uniref:Helix-turn-helix domain-containing protein n=1 Tax=Vallicoccus soli TaxID=2339232 RepID=A0A3A3YYN3_9ACTN|nr:hypothetical protein [Vallicoccus soli]RJK95942.1 hypothetical protein D5H78_10125 [Vallicoccus soli]